jgi:hypothetical protein
MGAFTPQEREWVLDSVIASQALAGVAVSREEAARLLDEAEGGPLPLIASADVPRDEAWVCEPPTPLQRAAGFAPRVLGKIVGLGV